MRLIFLLIALVTVSQAAEQNSPTKQRVRVIVPLDSAAAFDQALTEVVREFNSSQNNYHVELMRKGTPFQSLRTIIASHYAHDLPDLALINEADVSTLTNLGIVRALPDTWFSGKKFLPHFLASQAAKAKCDGQHCSAPFQRRVPAWFFNRELLFKLNQETERIPTNWAALGALSLRLTKQDTIWGMAVPVVGELVLPRWTAMGLSTSAAPVDASTELAQKLWAARASWIPGSPNVDEANRRFIEQRAVILLGSIEQTAYLKANVSFKLGSTLPEGELAWFGTDFVLLANTPAKAAGAREFLDYLYKPKISLNLFKAAATLPVTKSQLEDAGWKKEIEQSSLLKAAVSRKLKGSALEKIPPQIREEWATVVWRAVEQEVPASDRASKTAELKAALQKLLSTNPR